MERFVKELVRRIENRIKYNEKYLKTFSKARMCFTYKLQISTYKNVIDIINQLAEEYNNGFCEWKGIDMLGLYNSSCQQKSIVNPFWTYCPYCGKKIKVIEPKGE